MKKITAFILASVFVLTLAAAAVSASAVCGSTDRIPFTKSFAEVPQTADAVAETDVVYNEQWYYILHITLKRSIVFSNIAN